MGKNYPDFQITEYKIRDLEKKIETFILEQDKNIEITFNSPLNKYQNIEYDYNFHKNDDSFIIPYDYSIQWTINNSNITNCHLIIFNIGGFLGYGGFLYSICIFYYYFMKIPIENRFEFEIKQDYDHCLEYIDNRDTKKLNLKWNVVLNDNVLNDLKKAKNFLINLFQTKKPNKTMQLKNNVNRNYLIHKIFSRLNSDYFCKNNIFIIAIDNKDSFKNFGATFMGYYIEGLEKKARRLDLLDFDNFCDFDSGLYEFYKQIIFNITSFFKKNYESINNINKRLNTEFDIKDIIDPDKALIDDEFRNLDEVLGRFEDIDLEINKHKILEFKNQNNYEKKEILGQGSFGITYKIINTKNNKYYALKQIYLKKIKEVEINNIENEVNILKSINNENVVKYVDFFKEENFANIIMEYCANFDLLSFINNIKEEKKLISPSIIYIIIKDICLGLKEIHNKNIIHRDLKPENIFISEDYKLKIGDFGISKKLDGTKHAKTFTGTKNYMAPEILIGKKYTNKVDIYSLGCIIYELCTLTLCFECDNEIGLINTIINGIHGKIDLNIYNKEYQILIDLLLDINQENRPNIDEVLTFIKNNNIKLINSNDSINTGNLFSNDKISYYISKRVESK